tara:strand:+ start:216 stop:596 length:381 start_codon:yes stop_codon:yes gene_type:complete
MNISPSPLTISNLINSIHECQQAIDSTILIGEKVAMIQETAHLYNRMKSLITPEYLLDEEYKWLRNVASSWNEEMAEYQSFHEGNMPHTSEDISEMLNDMIDDIMDMDGFEPPQDNGGFDGGDGIH